MHRSLIHAVAIAWLIVMYGLPFAVQAQQESIKLELSVIPGAERYADLLTQPGYLAVALESNDLSPSLSSKLKIGEQGASAEIRNAVVRFTGRNGAVFSYEAGVTLGIGDSKLTFPVTVDASGMSSGRVVMTLTPPLANLIPTELTDRIRIKTQLIASAAAQQKVLGYLDRLTNEVSSAGGSSTLVEAILLDAYNRSGGPGIEGRRDVGDAVPLSDQWLLILTLVIWLIVVPVVLFVQRFRRGRRQAA